MRAIGKRIGRIFAALLLKVFYHGYHEVQLYRLPNGWIFSMFFHQKILRSNSHIRFPVHFTNQIGRTGYLKLHGETSAILALSSGLYIQTINGVEIGRGTLIAPGAKIISANHNLDDLDIHASAPPVIIGENCWLGANCSILPGVRLGNGVVVGSGAVVTKSFPDNSVLAGVPARVIKMRD